MGTKARVTVAGLVASFVLCAQPLGTAEGFLMLRMNHFAQEYNEFTAGMQAGRFDLRQAKRLSKLWREVEGCGMWPGERKGR